MDESAHYTLQFLAWGTIGFTLLGFAAMIALHVVRSDLVPGQHMISEYALGPHNWLIAAFFWTYGIATLCLAITLVANLSGWGIWLGALLLLAGAVGMYIGGQYPMDPTTTVQADMSFSGRMHGVGFMVGVPGMLLAAVVISLALRGHGDWSATLLLIVTAAIWISMILMAYGIMTLMKAPETTVPNFGWPNRALMGSFGIWLILVALPLGR